MYDPSPIGWKLPISHKVFSNFSKSNTTYAETYYGRFYNENPDIFFPFTGSLSNSDGTLPVVNSQTRYWTSSVASSNTYNCLVYQFGNGSSSAGFASSQNIARANGCSVRPCKE